MNVSVLQVQAQIPQGPGAEVGGRGTGEDQKGLGLGNEEGKVEEDTPAPLAADRGAERGQGRDWRDRVNLVCRGYLYRTIILFSVNDNYL